MLQLNRLPNHQRNEQAVLFLRRHWIQLLALAGYAVFFILIPIAVWIVLNILDIQITGNFWGPILSVVLSCYLIFTAVILITQFTDYYLDTWIVTNERIINIEQKGLFKRIISTLHLNQVQDVTAETKGFLNTFLTYGDVYIQTAGTRERFNFKTVDNPEEVKHTIIKLVEEDKRRHGDASNS